MPEINPQSSTPDDAISGNGEGMARTEIWTRGPSLAAPCADISYRWESGQDAVLEVRLHLSRIVGGHDFDLLVRFDAPIALAWDNESFDFVTLPAPVPRCTGERFNGFAHPMLVVKESNWAAQYVQGHPVDDRTVVHLVFLALNDSIAVLSSGDPEVIFVPPELEPSDRSVGGLAWSSGEVGVDDMPGTIQEILDHADELREEVRRLRPIRRNRAASLGAPAAASSSRTRTDRTRHCRSSRNSRADGLSWAKIGALLGTSAQAVQRRYGATAP